MTKLNKKLFEIQKKNLSFAKNADNPFFKSKYIPLDTIVSTLSSILEKEQILITHFTENKEVVTQVTDIESGEHMQSRFPLVEVNDPQKLGSCITYAKRYNLGQIFNIITDRDDDAEGAYDRNEKPHGTPAQFDGHVNSFKRAKTIKELDRKADGARALKWNDDQRKEMTQAYLKEEARINEEKKIS